MCRRTSAMSPTPPRKRLKSGSPSSCRTRNTSATRTAAMRYTRSSLNSSSTQSARSLRRFVTRPPGVSSCVRPVHRLGKVLLLENLPVLVVDELEALGHQPDGGDNSAHNARQRSRAHDIHEQAITRLVGFVDRVVQQRVIENEQLVLAPVVYCISNLDVGRAILHVVEIV